MFGFYVIASKTCAVIDNAERKNTWERWFGGGRSTRREEEEDKEGGEGEWEGEGDGEEDDN